VVSGEAVRTGHASAAELNEIVHRHFPEDRVYRIDHFLGKEAVQNLMIFRFSNTVLEPVWNRHYVRGVQITMAEDFGIEGRGRSTTRWVPSGTSSRTTCSR
jgi:glucose-6-phosphate 1-dehydrogenase